MTTRPVDGGSASREAHGFLATVFQHEFDHLDGILYVDRLKDPFPFCIRRGIRTVSSGELTAASPPEAIENYPLFHMGILAPPAGILRTACCPIGLGMPSNIKISTGWLNRALGEHAGSNRIIDYRIDNIGDGKGFGGKVLRVYLSRERPSGLESVIVKLPVDDPDTLQSMVVQDMLLREIRFYRNLASDIDLDIPTIYYTELNGNDFAIVMEDLGDVTHRMLKPLAMEELEVALRSAAKLHAAFWNSPILNEAWLRPVVDGNDASRNNNEQSLRHAIELLEQSPDDTAYTEACAHRLLALLPKAPRVTPLPKPVTLAHGDFHGNNLHIRGDDITIFDWQLVAKGTPAMDVANLIASSSEPGDYHQILEPLLRTYHDALMAEGITNYSFKQLQRRVC